MLLYSFRRLARIVVVSSLVIIVIGCVRPFRQSVLTSATPRQFEGGTLQLQEYWRLRVTVWPSAPRMVASGGLLVFVPLVPQRFMLRAVGMEDGRDKWQILEDTPYIIRALAAGHEHIFVGQDREVRAYQIANGQLSWTRPLSIPDRVSYSFRVTPSELQVYAHSGGSSEIYNLDTARGDLSSVSRVHDNPNQEARILESDGQEYWLNDRGGHYTLRSVNTTSGQLNWEWAMPGSFKYIPEIIEQRMYLNFGTEIVGLDLSEGHPVWSMSADAEIVSNLALGEHEGCFLQKDIILTCLDLSNGNTMGQVQFHPTLVPPHTEDYWVLIHKKIVLIYFGDSGEIIALGPSR